MEDVGIPIKNETLVVKPKSLSEIRTREEELNSEKIDSNEKRQKLEIVTTNNNSSKQQVGLLDNLLAKLSSPRVNSNPGDDSHDVVEEGGSVIGSDDVGTNNGVGGGGVMDKISSYFNRGGEDEGGNGKSDGGEGSKVNGVGEESSNGASIISSLIPDGVAPASDEASILIHSVVHD